MKMPALIQFKSSLQFTGILDERPPNWWGWSGPVCLDGHLLREGLMTLGL